MGTKNRFSSRSGSSVSTLSLVRRMRIVAAGGESGVRRLVAAGFARLALRFLADLLAFLGDLQGLNQHFGMRENIIVNDFLQGLVGGRHFAGFCCLRKRRHAAQEREQARNREYNETPLNLHNTALLDGY